MKPFRPMYQNPLGIDPETAQTETEAIDFTTNVVAPEQNTIAPQSKISLVKSPYKAEPVIPQESNISSFDKAYNKSSVKIKGGRNRMIDLLNDNDTPIPDGAAFENEETGERFIHREGNWLDKDWNPFTADIGQKPKDVTNAEWESYSNIQDIAQRQKNLDTLRTIEYLSNAIAATNQPKTLGFEAPQLTFTPIESTRDRDLAELRRQVISSAAGTKNLLEERGLVDKNISVLAEELNQIRSGGYQIAAQDAQRIAANTKGFDEYFNAQSAIDAETVNKNIEKTMRENQALGAEYTGNMENAFRTATDINRQNLEMSMAKSLMATPGGRKQWKEMYLNKYGHNTLSKTKKSEEDNLE